MLQSLDGFAVRRSTGVRCAVCALLVAAPAHALVTVPVGGHKGETNVTAGATLERGKLEPNDNSASWQEAKWQVYSIAGGHTIGDLGALQDFFVRLDYSFYDSRAEVVPAENVVAACGGSGLPDGDCEIHPDDRGHLISPQVGFNLVHEPEFSFGVYGLFVAPIDVNFEKFALPRTDFFAGGTAVRVRLARPWLTYESRTYFGSGPLNGEQNATVALINNFGVHAERWLLPWKAGFRAGPYFDADLTERFDERYDDTFIAGVPVDRTQTSVDPEGTRDRIRMMRFGVTAAPYVNVGDSIALEFNYTQKIFGYDTPATRFFRVAVHAAF